MNKILLVGKDRKYYSIEKDEENVTLKSTGKYAYATDFVQYGFEFSFGKHYGENNKDFSLFGHLSPLNFGLSEKEVGQKNLDKTVRELEKIVKEAKADFILIDDFYSKNSNTGWEISGRAKLLIKR